MTYSADEAAARYLDQKHNDPGYCLKETREAYGVGSLYADAAEAWQYALGKHPGDTTPPYGAPVYWTGGSSGYGHIAIYVGDGNVRSSDAGGAGVMGTKPIDWFRSAWGLPYAGWAESVNGIYIPGLGDDDMALSDSDLDKIASAVVNKVLTKVDGSESTVGSILKWTLEHAGDTKEIVTDIKTLLTD